MIITAESASVDSFNSFRINDDIQTESMGCL